MLISELGYLFLDKSLRLEEFSAKSHRLLLSRGKDLDELGISQVFVEQNLDHAEAEVFGKLILRLGKEIVV